MVLKACGQSPDFRRRGHPQIRLKDAVGDVFRLLLHFREGTRNAPGDQHGQSDPEQQGHGAHHHGGGPRPPAGLAQLFHLVEHALLAHGPDLDQLLDRGIDRTLLFFRVPRAVVARACPVVFRLFLEERVIGHVEVRRPVQGIPHRRTDAQHERFAEISFKLRPGFKKPLIELPVPHNEILFFIPRLGQEFVRHVFLKTDEGIVHQDDGMGHIGHAAELRDEAVTHCRCQGQKENVSQDQP